MIISHSHRYYFVKTKKTAGTSIECALAPHLSRGDWASPLVEHSPEIRPLSIDFVQTLRARDPDIRARNPHLPATVIRDHFARETEGYRSFCVERNPWDKAVSAFFFWVSRHPDPKNRSTMENFNAFTRSPQLGFFSDFDLYMDGDKKLVDKILRYENLSTELDQVTDTIGLPSLQIGQIRAKSEQRPASARGLDKFFGTDFDNDASGFVRRVFAREIEYFGYAPER